MSTISPVSTTTTGELVGGLCVALFPLSKTSRLRNRITGLCNRTHILSKFAGGGRDSTDSDQLKEKKRKAKAELANERKATRVNIITNGESQRNKNQKLRYLQSFSLAFSFAGRPFLCSILFSHFVVLKFVDHWFPFIYQFRLFITNKVFSGSKLDNFTIFM
jgi:hypothetical protein